MNESQVFSVKASENERDERSGTVELSAADRGTKIAGVLGRVYLAVMLLGLPLVIHDGYFDITEAKTLWFVIFTLFFLAARLVCVIQFAAAGRHPSLPKKPEELAALIFCFITLLSSLGTGKFTVSFIGETGRWQGSAMLMLYAGVFFAFGGLKLKDRDVLLPLGAGLALTGLLAVCSHLGWDVFGLEKNLGSFDRGRYISTLGNINFAGAYLSLALPVTAAAMLSADSRGVRAALGAVCAVGFCAVLAVRSDCAVLGLGTAALAMPFFLPRRRDALCRCWLLWPATMLLGQIYRLLAALAGARFSTLTTLLLHPAIACTASLAGLALYYWTRRGGDAGITRLLRGYGFTILTCMALGVLGLVAVNTVFARADLGRWGVWLRFSDAWGTDRIKIWKYCLDIYGDFPVWEKLLGGGCGALAEVDRYRRIFPDAILDAAHCEYIQILLNWGALGLTAYLVWLLAAGRRAFRSGCPMIMALGIGVLGYGVQASVNIAQAPGIMLFFVLLAALRADFPRESSQ